MKRCPHCRAQDNEDAIICKQCHRYFSEPVAAAPLLATKKVKPPRKDSGQTAQKAKSAFGAIRLLLFVAAFVYFIGVENIDRTLRSIFDESRTPELLEDAPADDPSAEPARQEVPAPVSATPELPSAAPPPADTSEPAVNPAPTPPKTRPPQAERKAPTARPDPPPDPPATRSEVAPAAPVPVAPPPPPAPSAAPPPDSSGPVRVGGNIRPPRKIRDVSPVYPPAARSARVEGIVILEATIDADGDVQRARVLRSIPQLDDAALDAVRQWRFEPTMVNGVATPIIMTVTVRFSLR